MFKIRDEVVVDEGSVQGSNVMDSVVCGRGANVAMGAIELSISLGESYKLGLCY